MKNSKYTLLLFLITAITGCTKLDEDPLTFITPDQFFKTKADANASCLGMYPDMYNISESWVNAARGVEGNLNDGRMLNNNVLEPVAGDGGHMTLMWKSYYQLARKANTTLDGLENSTSIPLFEKNQFIGEAKAMRAFAYLRLVKNWGDVPMQLSTFSESSSRPVTPMKDVYLQIFKDLNDALYVTPIFGPGAKPGRIDNSGVRMIMADAAITIAQSAASYKNAGPDAAALKPYDDAFGNETNKYFEIAKNQLDTLINQQNVYRLYDGKNGSDWITMFGRTSDGTDRVDNCESIIRTMTIPNSYTGGQFTVPGQSDIEPSSVGDVVFVPTYEYVSSFDKDDLRRQYGFLWFYKNINTESNTTEYHIPIRQFGNEPFDRIGISGLTATYGYADYPNSSNGEQWESKTIIQVVSGTAGNIRYTNIVRDAGYPSPACAKYFDQYSQSGDPAISTPLYRMAEAYLMYAEASVNLNGITQDALDKFNAIHSRAFADPDAHKFTIADFPDLASFNNALVDEYLWEFGFENKVPLVLIRFGKLQERIKQVTHKYQPKFSSGYDGPVLPTEAEALDTQYKTRQRKKRGIEQYWLPYPISGEIELNDAMKGLTRMKY